jgi:hypothetical protein
MTRHVADWKAEMAKAHTESATSLPERSRRQFSLGRIFVATTAVAILISLASWGGWVKSDAVVYLSIAAVAGVFWSAARRALLGACAILGAIWLAGFFSDFVFGQPPGRFIAPPGAIWIFEALMAALAASLRLYTRANALSLVASLMLIELLIVAIIVYTYGCSTLFQALESEHRPWVFRHFLTWFPEQRWYIVAPWLLGIVAGEILARTRKPTTT